MRVSNILRFLLVVAALASMAVGCAAPEATPVATEEPTEEEPEQVEPTAAESDEVDTEAEPIRIGGIGPLSPPGAIELGEEVMNAMQMRVDEINAAGGLLGRPVELVFEDTAGTPETGTAAMEKLVSKENVVAVAGEGHSSAFLAEMEVAHRAGIVILPAECWSDQIRLTGYPEVFAVAPSNSLVFLQIAEFLEGAGFERPYILSEDSDYGIEALEILKDQAVELGLEADGMVVDRTTKDFVPFLLQVQDYEPDILVVNVTGVGAHLIIKQSKEIGLAPTADTLIFSTAAETGFPELWETAGDAAQYVLWNTPVHPRVEFTELTKGFVDSYTAAYGRPPVSTGLQAYDAVLAIEEAIRRAGSTDGAAMIAELEKAEFTGTRGTLRFPTEAGLYYHQAPAPLLFVQFAELNMAADETEIIWPLDYATAELAWPE
jgi:branched-chain amino acid transport system substrate-binding protein